MSTLSTILQILDNAQIKYQRIEHEPVFTMEQAAEVCGHAPEQGVKSLLVRFYTSKKVFEYWLVIGQGNEPVPFDTLLQTLGLKKWKLASPEEVMEELGIEIGALSPFGYSKAYPVLFDQRLMEQEQIFINAGVHDTSIALAPSDLSLVVKESSTQFLLY